MRLAGVSRGAATLQEWRELYQREAMWLGFATVLAWKWRQIAEDSSLPRPLPRPLRHFVVQSVRSRERRLRRVARIGMRMEAFDDGPTATTDD